MNDKYVIEGLEHCRIGDCVGCPYDETRKQSLVCDKHLTWRLACNEQLTEDILELLKENQRQQARSIIMKILKKGKVVPFVCRSCGCEFAIGINVVNTPDKGENYYACCPMCGNECHTDVVDIQRFEEREREKTK